MTSSLSLHPATAADDRAVAYLAELDEAARPAGDLLVAYEDGRPVAAVSLTDGSAVADPFARTADVVALLRLRARQARSRSPRRLGLGLGRVRVAA